MSPGKPPRAIKVRVPRHNSQRIGPALTSQVQTLAAEQGARVDVRQTALEQSSALALAVESASEWNSLLITARAERGPQWDCGTQQFLVDEGSELYYDPSPLLETVNKQLPKDEDSADRDASMHPPDMLARSPSMQRQASSGQYGYNVPMSPAMSSRQGAYPASPYTSAPSNQYYGDAGSPVKMGYPADNFSPDRRRMTRGNMADDSYPGFHGN
ncbi:hypothetical protein GLOTRDRAFT_130489 [Gloeophyllum trabeum ATCC 11539]|uniref:Uncharacterized protein n=1 Tax=Gloeophyllum trabeum (strain ATCC 11539 / FP-39264 / Madison 617) TaxID=670483 RepID=S7RJ45_GLOTA|nr:uncharacterized protein GLOTRDRAFT_130489 [Gloeophyllum trabeum ATCC 11539]EPQ54375.1 hypothetical protein GLOTRDRAFT_130489 [Gloeophyllum trabeum ATCC 11539]